MKKRNVRILFVAIFLVASLFLTGCLGGGDDTSIEWTAGAIAQCEAGEDETVIDGEVVSCDDMPEQKELEWTAGAIAQCEAGEDETVIKGEVVSCDDMPEQEEADADDEEADADDEEADADDEEADADDEEADADDEEADAGTEVTFSGDCPTDGEMQAAHGFDDLGIKPVNTGRGVKWDGCKWTLQAVSRHVFEDVPFLEGWQYTYTDRNGQPTVAYGDGKTHDIMGATIRYLPFYEGSDNPGRWVLNPNYLFAGEMRYGLTSDPAYLHENFNLELNSCPTTTAEVAEMVGGEAEDWTAPDWEGGAWDYDGPSINFTVPSDLPNWVDLNGQPIWAGRDGSGAEFSYHCHDGE